MINDFKRIVIKVGTSTLTDKKGLVDPAYLDTLASQIAELRSHGKDVLLVSSGAIRAGMEKLGMKERPKTIPEAQAAAAIGQGILMHTYSQIFAQHGLATAQVLLTREDFGERKRYLNARNTMLTLFRHGVISIVNENDTVAVDEIRFGDNDTLAALVASSVDADLLILLSDVQGLYDKLPGEESDAKLIPMVDKIDDRIKSIAGGTKGLNGVGGMRTKIEAAQISMKSGVTMVIADGKIPNIIQEIVSCKSIGTTFTPSDERLCSRKRWIAFGIPSRGKIIVNDGAKNMICRNGKSLLAAGITDVVGRFTSGDLVKVSDQEGNQIARGFVNYSAEEISKIKGRRSSEIEEILGYKGFDEVIHRDNLALAK